MVPLIVLLGAPPQGPAETPNAPFASTMNGPQLHEPLVRDHDPAYGLDVFVQRWAIHRCRPRPPRTSPRRCKKRDISWLFVLRELTEFTRANCAGSGGHHLTGISIEDSPIGLRGGDTLPCAATRAEHSAKVLLHVQCGHGPHQRRPQSDCEARRGNRHPPHEGRAERSPGLSGEVLPGPSHVHDRGISARHLHLEERPAIGADRLRR